MRSAKVIILDEAETGPVYFLPTPCGYAKVTGVEPVSEALSTILSNLERYLDED